MGDYLKTEIKKIGIIGGTGKEGKGLAYRWANAGYEIKIGSRQIEKAVTTANELGKLISGNGMIEGVSNLQAAEEADLAVLTVPFSAHRLVLESVKPYLSGKILIDVTVPLVPPKVTVVQMPPAGSSSKEAQQILGDSVMVVAAFQNISYENLLQNRELHCDILVCGNSSSARDIVIKLIRDIGLVGLDAGPLENAVVVEGLTSILIGLNKRFGVKDSGIQITGIPRT